MNLALPAGTVGLRLCKMRGEDLTLCETVIFEGGLTAVETTLRRAAISGPVGPVGETGDYWADLMDEKQDWIETIALSRGAWRSLKSRWMRCRIVRDTPA